MNTLEDQNLLEGIRNTAIPLEGPGNHHDLIDLIGDASFVLLGAATHGTHEFCQARAAITMRLIREKNFAAVAMEADWPDAYRVNRYVRGMNLDRFAIDSMNDLKRFPAWMWRNTEILDFVADLHDHNTLLPEESKAGFYGLDLYSYFTSAEMIIDYLEANDPEAAKRARYRYASFEQFNHGEETYGLEADLDIDERYENEIVARLREMQQQSFVRISREGFAHRGELFHAQQSALLGKNAEEYYRTMFSGRTSIWNLRDRHMADTIDALAVHFSQKRPAKIVVWENNSHIGDARATDFSRWGAVNLGQIMRERHGSDVFLAGFTTSHGTVSAASDWGESVERKHIRLPIAGSYEDLFHRTGAYSFLLPLRNLPENLEALNEPRLERAIGAIYLPLSEQNSHCYRASLPQQYDAVIHLDHTTAVEPLEYTPVWDGGEITEAFQVGL